LYPNSNIKTTEEILKYINFEIIIQYVSWFSYLILFIILLNINISQTQNIYLKIFFTIIILFLIYLPVFPILNIINLLLIILLDNPPFFNNIDKEFPINKSFENNYNIIKNEFINYNGNIECFRKSNPLLDNIDKIDIDNNFCWRTLYLKQLGKIINDDKTKLFPETLKLIDDEQIHNAFFSVLDPYVEIKPHIGYYKGYLRYHLGVIIPEENGNKPYIICGGQKREWIEGKGLLFDDMFLHYVNNNTNKKRVVLYLDIKRKNINWFTDFIIKNSNYLTENSIIINIFLKNQHLQDKLDIIT
jgi:beta-hydroxylase